MARPRTALLLLVAVLCVFALAPAASLAGPKRITQRFNAELRVGELQLGGEGTGTFAGEFRCRQLGNGATVYTTEGEGVVGERSGEMSIWTKDGRIDILLKSTFTEQPDGSVRNDGTGRIIGGTGLYLAARGRFTVLAILKLTDEYTTVRIKKGKITFPAPT